MNLLKGALALVFIAVPSQAQTTKVFTSPDQALRAVVWTGPTGESRTQIQGRFQSIRLTHDETSADGFHGYGVCHAAWTADSQFFVASTEAAGGHQPWARPIWVYSRAKNRVFELGKMGLVSVADFTLKSPDVIEMKLLNCKNGRGDLESRFLTLSLHQIVSTRRLPAAPCSVR